MLEHRIDEFLIVCTNKGLSRKTVGSYEQGLRMFERYLREEKGVVQEKQIKNIHIQEYIAYLRERDKYTVVRDERSRRRNHPQNRKDLSDALSATTVNNYLRNSGGFFNGFNGWWKKEFSTSRATKKILLRMRRGRSRLRKRWLLYRGVSI